ncbi:hypothetical protein MaudCBS49596_008011 [Microsporum audouinii]
MKDIVTDSEPVVSPAFHPLVIGNPGDERPSHEQITAIVATLQDAGICCCFVQEYALIYYGARRNAHDRVLCIPDSQLERAVEVFTSNRDILEPCGPLPLRRSGSLDHKYPRFKAVGRTDFWLLLPASYCHITCEPDSIEWSQGRLPYPKLHVYVQSLIDTKNKVDLADLVDGMDLTEDWGMKYLNLEGNTDTEWLENLVQRLKEDGPKDRFMFVFPQPMPRLKIWKEFVETKQSRMGWKYSSELYATRFRRYGSKDPRSQYRPGI